MKGVKMNSMYLDLRMIRCDAISHKTVWRRQPLIHVYHGIAALREAGWEGREDPRGGVEAGWTGTDDREFEGTRRGSGVVPDKAKRVKGTLTS